MKYLIGNLLQKRGCSFYNLRTFSAMAKVNVNPLSSLVDEKLKVSISNTECHGDQTLHLHLYNGNNLNYDSFTHFKPKQGTHDLDQLTPSDKSKPSFVLDSMTPFRNLKVMNSLPIKNTN